MFTNTATKTQIPSPCFQYGAHPPVEHDISFNNGVLTRDFGKLYRHCFTLHLHNVSMQFFDTGNIFNQGYGATDM
jgi:hypothetical protein